MLLVLRSLTYSEWNGAIVRVVSGFVPWFLALNVGCIAAIIAAAWLVAWKIGRLLWSAASDGSGNTAKRNKGL